MVLEHYIVSQNITKSNMRLDYKEFDFEGEKTLKAIASADNFNEWMYSCIKIFCKGKILEIGSGIGNISKYFIYC